MEMEINHCGYPHMICENPEAKKSMFPGSFCSFFEFSGVAGNRRLKCAFLNVFSEGQISVKLFCKLLPLKAGLSREA